MTRRNLFRPCLLVAAFCIALFNTPVIGQDDDDDPPSVFDIPTAEPVGDVFFSTRATISGLTSNVPLAGGSRPVKVSENSMALPLDRILFSFNHFHNAMESEDAVGGIATSESLDRYTFGFERTFWNKKASVEVRMPFTSGVSFSALAGDPSISGGEIGNLAVITKFLLYVEQRFSWVAGVGMDLPTGSDVEGIEAALPFRIENDAFHVLPYTGVMLIPNDRLFYHAFVQADIPTNGNNVIGLTTDRIMDQPLLFLDVSAGYWLYRAPSRASTPGLTGIASLIELHYTTSLDSPSVTNIDFTFESVDLLNLTVGFHFEFGSNLAVRFAGVLPVEQSPHQFDSELQGSVIWRF